MGKKNEERRQFLALLVVLCLTASCNDRGDPGLPTSVPPAAAEVPASAPLPLAKPLLPAPLAEPPNDSSAPRTPAIVLHPFDNGYAAHILRLSDGTDVTVAAREAERLSTLLALAARRKLVLVVDRAPLPQVPRGDFAYGDSIARRYLHVLPPFVEFDLIERVARTAREEGIPIYWVLGEVAHARLVNVLIPLLSPAPTSVGTLDGIELRPRAGRIDRSGTVPALAPETLVLIGLQHHDAEGGTEAGFDALERHLLRRARRGEIIFCMEGWVFDRDALAATLAMPAGDPCAPDRTDPPRIGIEQPLAMTLGILLSAHFESHQGPEGYRRLRREQILALLAREPAARTMWERLGATPPSERARELYRAIDAALPPAGALSRVVGTSAERLGDEEAWRALSREWLDLLIAELAAEGLPRTPDLDELRTLVGHPSEPAAADAAFWQVTIRYRNDFMAENLRQAVAAARARGLPIYALVGKMHIEGLLEKLGPEVEGSLVVPFDDLAAIPREYLLGAGAPQVHVVPLRMTSYVDSRHPDAIVWNRLLAAAGAGHAVVVADGLPEELLEDDAAYRRSFGHPRGLAQRLPHDEFEREYFDRAACEARSAGVPLYIVIGENNLDAMRKHITEDYPFIGAEFHADAAAAPLPGGGAGR